MSQFSVGCVQINNGFAGQYYLPYSIGTLQAYFLKHSKNSNKYKFENTIYKRLLLDECVDNLKDCDIVLLSTYVWNINISLAVAKKLKEIDPKKFIIFGGPSAPDVSEKFLREHNFIDCIVHQEGERTITSVLDNFPDLSWQKVPGISFLDKENKFQQSKCLPKMRDISELPSPYLTGVFDNLIKKNPNEHWLASWETNRGCPFSCAFCDWGSAIASKVSRMDMEKLEKELVWFAEHKIEFIYVCDANFGILPRDYDIAKMALEIKKKYGYPHVLSVQTTKNARERSYKIQKLLYDGGMHKSINLAMQSTDEKTLKEIKRDNISIEDYKLLQKKFIADKIPTYSDLIIGLPGDNYKKFTKSVNDLIDSGQHYRIQFNNLSILPNAEMAQDSYTKRNNIITKEIPVVNMHGSLDDNPADGITESQHMVISTKDMPTKEWVRVRKYATATEFYYFNKMLQIPILLLSRELKKTFNSFFDFFDEINDSSKFPAISMVNNIFEKHANDITKGDAEFIFSKNFLEIYWPPGEFAMLTLYQKKLIKKFYDEAKFLLKSFVKADYLDNFIDDSINLNYELLKKPFTKQNKEIKLNYDIPAYYEAALLGKEFKIKKEKTSYVVESFMEKPQDFSEWAQKVIWYGHRRAAYFYDYKKNNFELNLKKKK
ncbi:MAG: radical SAM protein [Pelagibacteraceae bacterium]|jgi:radical SAM superfamily enzyme YgiQ (UPF0313 family)|nr:radical SAM protein [Pelagibacteraceae bacterium]